MHIAQSLMRDGDRQFPARLLRFILRVIRADVENMMAKASHKRLGALTVLSTFTLCLICLRYQTFFRAERIVRHKRVDSLKAPNVNDIVQLANATDANSASTWTETTSARNQLLDRTTAPKRDVRVLKPQCENILRNITVGRWVKRVDFLDKNDVKGRELWRKVEIDIEDELQMFWLKRGIQKGFWRPDHRCGYKNFEEAPENSTWPNVGSWCNARSERPCCTNSINGVCSAPSPKTCDCPSCVDLRKYLHADVSEWVVDDARCRWRNYTASEACDVVESSPFTDLHFVGDSFMRNMFRTFLMLLTGDTVRGAWCKTMTTEIMEKCTAMQQFFWKECRHNVLNMSELIYVHKLCGGRGKANFTASMQPYYSPKFEADFYNLTVNNLGKEGTLLIVSVGFHMGCVPNAAIDGFLRPAVEAIEKYYGGPLKSRNRGKLSGRWPQIVLALPLSIGLLKPPKFLRLQNELKCEKYSRAMVKYAAEHDIEVFDFRPLTSWVHSFDGTHHGINVNLVKNKILLNYISSLQTS